MAAAHAGRWRQESRRGGRTGKPSARGRRTACTVGRKRGASVRGRRATSWPGRLAQARIRKTPRKKVGAAQETEGHFCWFFCSKSFLERVYASRPVDVGTCPEGSPSPSSRFCRHGTCPAWPAGLGRRGCSECLEKNGCGSRRP